VTVADIFVFSLGFFAALLLGLIIARMAWTRAVRITRARLERDRPETLRAFEARIAGAQARAAVSIREMERSLERERQISAQARLMADQMTSSSSLAMAERDDTQTALVNLSETLDSTRERLRQHEEVLSRRSNELDTSRRELAEARQELAMRDEDVRRAESEAAALRSTMVARMSDELDPQAVAELTSGGAADMAREQIDNLRETVRSLRAEKTAAEASAARARLMLNAREDSEAIAALKTDHEAERKELHKKIADLEAAQAQSVRTPQLVSINTSPSTANANRDEELEALRTSIDAMTASLTASATVEESPEAKRINELLDQADHETTDSALVTSLVEARERLRNQKAKAEKRAASQTRTSAKKAAKQDNVKQASGKPDTPAVASNDTSAEDTAPPKRSAKRRSSAMPRASESDINVV
jgi:hypothetical protein